MLIDRILITNPPIDELLDRASSKYALVIYAAKRARRKPSLRHTRSITPKVSPRASLHHQKADVFLRRWRGRKVARLLLRCNLKVPKPRARVRRHAPHADDGLGR